MWPQAHFNRPLIIGALVALTALPWLPGLELRLAALLPAVLAGLDIARQRRRQLLHRQLLEAAVHLSSDGLVISDRHNRVLAVNAAFSHITGYAPEEIIGRNPSLLSSGRHDEEFHARYRQALEANGHWEGEVWNRRKQGDEYPEWLRARRIEQGGDVFHVALFTDITRHKAREQDLQRLGLEDALTGLPNRRRLGDLLVSRLNGLRAGEAMDLALIDIDELKSINDALGAEGGDRLLQQFSQRLTALARGGVVGRIGGDEFVILRSTAGGEHTAWVDELRQVLTKPFEIGDQALHLALSIGSCRAPEDGADADVLMQRLESALYAAKRHGRNTDMRFQPALDAGGDLQLGLANDLRVAIESQGQLQLHYQCQHDASTGKVASVEALLRWKHPLRGGISPAEFVPLAERHGLMLRLGNWVLREAVQQQASWRRAGHRLCIWVNVSALQLIQGGFEASLAGLLMEYGVPASSIGLELTESVLLDERAGDVSRRLAALRARGHQIAVDDFGTGYSSLAYLKDLPVDKLKLDRAFIRSLPGERADAAITMAVLAMAKGLGMEMIAEGVETAEQREYLVSNGCGWIQGFYFSRPAPAGEVIERLNGYEAGNLAIKAA
ncbi:EAL domain-containing protein [Cobetia sp. SIMBA_158]|uniref:putative bifunctional diguanylate cyclase/phosphodiesterase n=1 Tax=Cobetia sp. SIMBA_158 TaxID=3081617 RepID=UPI0039803BA0